MAERPIDAELTPALDEAELAQVWRRVRDAQAERRVAPRRWRYAIATGVALATAAVLLVAWPRAHRSAGALGGDVALVPGAQIDAPAARTIAMTDGSRVALAPDARLEVLANEGDKFVTAVRRGKVGFDVRPGGPRKWVIETDLATVEVVGTAFAVERSAQGLTVTVDRGVVLVRGERVPGRIVRLTAGDRVAVAAPVAVLPPADLAPPGGPPPPPLDGAPPPSDDHGPPPVRPAPPRLDRGPPLPPPDRAPADRAPATPLDHAPPAPIEPPPAPIEPPPVAPPPADDIIDRADRLVAAGQADRAADALTAYLATAPADATAGLAAFLLGRLAQDQLAQPRRAADAFARVRAIGSPRAIQEEALVRQARALDRVGDHAGAMAAARAYLQAYPGGARTAEMTALSAP